MQNSGQFKWSIQIFKMGGDGSEQISIYESE